MSKRYPGGLITKTPVVPTSLSAPGIWTLNQQAAAQATNTWPFPRDPQFNYVTMLLHGDGSAGAVAMGSGAGASSTVTNFNADASTNNFNLTINGDARSNNFTPYQGSGYYSNIFNGSSGIRFADSADFSMGTNAFTVEGWFNVSSTPSNDASIISKWVNGNDSNSAWMVDFQSSNLSAAISIGGSVTRITGSVGITLNTFNHFALVRSGSPGTLSLFLNGTRIATSTPTGSIVDDTNSVGIGIRGGTDGFYLTGYVSNIRVINGTDLYGATNTTITVPTTPLTAVTNTKLLTCQSNRFLDANTQVTAKAVSQVFGTPSVAPAQPFTLPSTVATYGSGYFDGSGDYLSAANNAAYNLNSVSFTVECWIYWNSVSGEQNIVEQFTPASGPGWTLYKFNAGTIDFYGGTGSINSGVTPVVGQWYHLAISRDNSTGTTSFYVNGTRTATATFGVASTAATELLVGVRKSGTTWFNGYMEDLRIVKGSYVYNPTATTITVPTAPLTAITNTSLLTTQYNGGGNNSGFKDSSQFNFPITRNGNTTQGSFSPYGSNWSNYFDGSSNSYISAPSNTALDLNATACTIEGCIYPTRPNNGAQSGFRNIISKRVSASLTVNYNIMLWYNSEKIGFYNGSTISLSAASIPQNTWTHFAYTFDGSTTLKLWINGVLDSTFLVGFGANNAATLNIGSNLDDTSTYNNFGGYISNIRIVKGSQLYSSTFTPSTVPLTAVSGTSLLTCQENRFVDASSNAFTITTSGSPSVQRFSPFSPTTAYSTSVIGGSGYFDGSGDYLNLSPTSAFAFGTGDFTVESWIYPTAAPATGYIIDARNSGQTSTWSLAFGYSGTSNRLEWGFNGSVIVTGNTTSVIQSQWNHIAYTRSGTTGSLYVNGTRIGTATDSNNYSTAPNTSYIATRFSAGSGDFLTGYFGDTRTVKGTAVYTGTSYTVPTAPLTTITNTSLLLSYTNAGILDNAMMNDLETVGNAQISTSVKKYGTGSMYFDGTGDNLSTLPSAGALGSGDWTVEFWWQWISNTGDYQTVVSKGIVGGTPANGSWSFGPYQQANNVWFAYYNSGFNDVSAAATLNDGAWHHMAASRQGTSLRLFADGVLKVTATLPANLDFGPSTSDLFLVGYNSRNARYINGYIDDLRITKGVARYTANFTVPDQAFPNG